MSLGMALGFVEFNFGDVSRAVKQPRAETERREWM